MTQMVSLPHCPQEHQEVGGEEGVGTVMRKFLPLEQTLAKEGEVAAHPESR